MSLTNRTVLLPQLHCINHKVSASAHALPAATWGRQHGSSSISGIDLTASYLYSGYRLVVRAQKVPRSYRHLHCSDCRKPADIRKYDSTHYPHLRHEPRLANCNYAWSQRLCGITFTVHELGWHLWKLRIQSLPFVISLCLVVPLWSIAAVLLSTQNWYFAPLLLWLSYDRCWRHYSVTGLYIVHWDVTLHSRFETRW